MIGGVGGVGVVGVAWGVGMAAAAAVVRGVRARVLARRVAAAGLLWTAVAAAAAGPALLEFSATERRQIQRHGPWPPAPAHDAGNAQAGRSAAITLGRHRDAPDGPAALKTRHVDLQHRNFGEFKVPSLRNVADTAPYLHDGQLATLDAVVNHYSTLNLDRLHADGEQILKPLLLTDGERADLVAFLRSLSDPLATRWQRPASDAAPTRRCGKV